MSLVPIYLIAFLVALMLGLVLERLGVRLPNDRRWRVLLVSTPILVLMFFNTFR